jgi:alpha-N-arabinofuranosidase
MRIPTTRRGFLTGTGAALFSTITSQKAFSWQAQEQRVTVSANSEIGKIRPELHGHFAEHLGSCTYGGLWVGKNSKIPNINGYRKSAVEYLKAVGIPVLRWPGGCFADDYHWRDGIGPQAKRPKSVNIWWGNYTEDNSFGTHEFIGLCKAIGAEPYLAGNVGSGTPEELRHWVEYCNYPSGTSLSDERARNGSPQPFGVKYWGVGNENWGCGGNMTSEEYCQKYRQYSTFMKNFGDTKLFLIACGPNSHNLDWTKRFFDTLGKRRMPEGYAMHFYSNGRNNATKFTVENMQQQLSSFARIETAVKEQRSLMDTYDPQKKVGLLVDEWGVWDRMDPDEEKKYGKLWQQITMRSAVAAALGLNVFHRQADKLVMCNIAQIVNVLHSLLLTEEEKCVRTSTYYAFDLMKGHRSKTAVKVEAGDGSPLGLSVSASRQGGDMVITFVNPKHDSAMKVNCALDGVKAASARGQAISHADYNACNTFANPNVIVPKQLGVEIQGSGLRLDLPAMSVATVNVKLS